ncbi:rCG63125 [Rattus norvegicus]|uniref:RCG63125 n=1 Tax=Rattus norvegicus TaxID=10116 RepID=A6KJL0_RAT|nr:rCG63125 [Rattus norvegicus]
MAVPSCCPRSVGQQVSAKLRLTPTKNSSEPMFQQLLGVHLILGCSELKVFAFCTTRDIY